MAELYLKHLLMGRDVGTQNPAARQMQGEHASMEMARSTNPTLQRFQ